MNICRHNRSVSRNNTIEFVCFEQSNSFLSRRHATTILVGHSGDIADGPTRRGSPSGAHCSRNFGGNESGAVAVNGIISCATAIIAMSALNPMSDKRRYDVSIELSSYFICGG